LISVFPKSNGRGEQKLPICEPISGSQNAKLSDAVVVVVEEVDGVLFEVSALVIVLDDHSDVLVPGHAGVLLANAQKSTLSEPGD
jgi:hypothetical protein